ncbi:hypothetical protein BDV95DRAFT_664362 [Massariosphaeria phaeospora]|uniref:Probable double zinc ribbon domain-containing protein n=1 Tax=Massariosphaeria phaeospora TaxID=100035 RepID=A0A7C8ME94_9PLEO|nr:hypothetical protein BDV95DRAFT_664362 [Massariosphaeria phaeospora]
MSSLKISPLQRLRTHLTTVRATKRMALSEKNLEKNLQKAQRAEPRTPYLEYAGAEFPHLQAAGAPQTMADGLWICACKHENKLVHYTGPHPFKYVRCDACDRPINKPAAASEIFTPLRHDLAALFDFNSRKLVPYGQVCRGCGLTHRAKVTKAGEIEFDGQVCACGEVADATWVRFAIGSPVRYRFDPEAAYVKVWEKRIRPRLTKTSLR